MANADDTKTSTVDNNGTTEVAKETIVAKKEAIVLTKDLEEKIIRQMEYYFGDINLPKDKFMQEQLTLDDGWVPITVLLTFNRLQKICNDADTIAKALLNSDKDLIIVSEDRAKVRRNPEHPIPEYNEERRKELLGRTGYAKGFTKDETLESLMKFFEPHGPFESVIMRYYKDKALKKHVFKGSVFIIFKEVESCKKFIEAEEIKFNDTPLIRKWQADYIEEKKQEREERNEKRGKNRKDAKEETRKPHTFPKGAILYMDGFKDDTVRETIKKQVTEIGEKEPAYITFDKGNKEGYIRFNDENGAVEFVKKLTDSKFKIDEAEITVRALEGEEEDKFLNDLADTISKMKHQNRHSGKGKNRKRKGGSDFGPRSKHERK